MTKFLSVVLMFFGFSMVAVDTADAARFGGGRSIGRFRQTIKPPVQRTAPAPQKSNTATPQPQKSGMSKWLGPLAGLAIGAGLASLFMNNGMAGVLAGILMVLALVMGAVFLVRFFMRGKTQQQSPPLQYAGAGNDRGADPRPTQSTAPAQFSGNAAPGSLAATVGGASVAATSGAMATEAHWPDGFDAAEFERQAKSNFVRLQAANDAGDASTLRDFVTPELYREIDTELKAAWGKTQKNDVVDLNAEVLEVITEQGLYIVSVQFTGKISESGAPAEDFSEIWHLEKPISGRSGWLVSGIQQA